MSELPYNNAGSLVCEHSYNAENIRHVAGVLFNFTKKFKLGSSTLIHGFCPNITGITKWVESKQKETVENNFFFKINSEKKNSTEIHSFILRS